MDVLHNDQLLKLSPATWPSTTTVSCSSCVSGCSLRMWTCMCNWLWVRRGKGVDVWGEGGRWWGESTDKWHEGRVRVQVGQAWGGQSCHVGAEITKFMASVGFTTGIPQVQFSDTVPLPVNTVTVVGEGMTPYMFGYGVIPKNIKFLHYPLSHQPQDRCWRRARLAAALTRVRMLVVPVAINASEPEMGGEMK